MCEVTTGNALTDGKQCHDGRDAHGWFIGHFVEDGDLRKSDDVEVKWYEPPPRELGEFTANRSATSCLILVRGRFRLVFRAGVQAETHEVRLDREGDYAIWGPGIFHDGVAESNGTLIICIRWPSAPGNKVRL